MSKHEVIPDFQIEMDRSFVIQVAEEQLKRVEKKIQMATANLILRVAADIVNITTGALWWKRFKYSKYESELLAEDLVLRGKLPSEDFYYDHSLHYERVELLYGSLAKQKKFLEDLISINDVNKVRLNSAAYKALTQ